MEPFIDKGSAVTGGTVGKPWETSHLVRSIAVVALDSAHSPASVTRTTTWSSGKRNVLASWSRSGSAEPECRPRCCATPASTACDAPATWSGTADHCVDPLPEVPHTWFVPVSAGQVEEIAEPVERARRTQRFRAVQRRVSHRDALV